MPKQTYKPPVKGVDYDVPISEAIKRAKDVNEFYILISYDTSFQEYRNSIVEEWRMLYVKPVKDNGPFFGGLRDVLELEDHLDEKLFGYGGTAEQIEQKHTLSVYDKCVMAYGKTYADAWRAYLSSNMYTYLIDRYEKLKQGYTEGSKND